MNNEKQVNATLVLNGKTINAVITDKLARKIIHLLASAPLPEKK